MSLSDVLEDWHISGQGERRTPVLEDWHILGQDKKANTCLSVLLICCLSGVCQEGDPGAWFTDSGPLLHDGRKLVSGTAVRSYMFCQVGSSTGTSWSSYLNPGGLSPLVSWPFSRASHVVGEKGFHLQRPSMLLTKCSRHCRDNESSAERHDHLAAHQLHADVLQLSSPVDIELHDNKSCVCSESKSLITQL